MGNHVHLLLKVGDEPLEKIFRRIGASFVYWYNLKYQRAGHLFQDRFKSEAVENDGYFLTVLRYILRNPVKAGICQRPEDYPYSNAKSIITGEHPTLPCDLSGRALAEFIAQDTDEACLDISEQARRGVTDSAANEMIRKEFGAVFPVVSAENMTGIAGSIQHLAEKGVSIRQISRLTGLSKPFVEKCLK